MLDYSVHRLEILKLDKEMHKQLLERSYEEALRKAEQMQAENKLLINAIKALINPNL